MRELEIDDELRDLLPPVYADLEIGEEGPRSPIVVGVWLEEGEEVRRIVDGHRRYAKCLLHNLPFQTVEIWFASKAAAAKWILKNQETQRNCSLLALARAKIRLERIVRTELEREAYARGEVVPASAIASSMLGTDVREKYQCRTAAEAVETLPAEIRDAIKNKELPAAKRDIMRLAELTEAEQYDVMDQLFRGEFRTLHECLYGMEDQEAVVCVKE